MRSSALNGTAQGALLGIIAFVLVTSSMPLAAAAASSSGPLFSMTLIAPTSNPVRRQWASIITSDLNNIGISANLVFVNFDVLLADFFNCPSGCPPPTYANGGWDAGFVGFGGGTPLPDFGTQNVVVYRDTGPGDVPPIGSNYYFFNNATYNDLSNQYSSTFSAAARTPILQQMVSIVMQQRPTMVLFYPTTVYAWAKDLSSWGSGNSITSTTANADYTHWTCSDGCTTLNIGETGDIGAINTFPTAAQNSYYSGYLFFPINACGECLDPRSTSYFDGTVSSVSSSADHLTWTVTEKSHTFTDGVAVTANDYIYTIMASLISQVGYVGEGTFQSLLGLNTQFTFTNGTTDYVVNGTYYHGAAPSGFTPDSSFTAMGSASSVSWMFTMPTAYIFTDPVITGVSATPMHLYDGYAFSTWSTGVLSGFTSGSGGLSTGPFTYHYSTSVYGGNGTGKSWGPLGDGAYIYHGYDPVALVGTLVQNPTYWNKTALQSAGWDKISTVHVVYINGKDAAIAALGNGQVNFLDSNYQFNPADNAGMTSAGETVVNVNDPSNGWQEMGLNLNNPVFGTGAATPLGSQNPAQAAFAARMVREAISYAIPRDYIVSQLLGGLGAPGITQVSPTFTFGYPAGSAPDPYNPTMAKSFLAAAGYQTGIPPPQGGTVPPIGSVTIGSVTVPGFLLGNSFTLTGSFSVDPVLGAHSNGFAITLQQSSDGGTTWTPVALGATNTGGGYTMTYSPTAAGDYKYRVFFTGLAETTVQGDGLGSASAVEALVPPAASLRPLNSTDTQYGPTSSLNVGSLGDLVNAITASVQTGINQLGSNVNASVKALQGTVATSAQLQQTNANIASLQDSVNSLQNTLNTTTYIAYAAIAVAIILGIAAIALARRKPA